MFYIFYCFDILATSFCFNSIIISIIIMQYNYDLDVKGIKYEYIILIPIIMSEYSLSQFNNITINNLSLSPTLNNGTCTMFYS